MSHTPQPAGDIRPLSVRRLGLLVLTLVTSLGLLDLVGLSHHAGADPVTTSRVAPLSTSSSHPVHPMVSPR